MATQGDRRAATRGRVIGCAIAAAVAALGYGVVGVPDGLVVVGSTAAQGNIGAGGYFVDGAETEQRPRGPTDLRVLLRRHSPN